MKSLLTILMLVFFSSVLCAQEQSYLYDHDRGTTRLISRSDTVTFLDYYLVKNGPRERRVQMDGKSFLLAVSRDKDRIQTISQEGGQRYGTVSLGTKNRYNIILADGTVAECTVAGRTWAYTINGKEVIRATHKRENGQKQIVVSGEHLNNLSPVIVISCLERAIDKYASSGRTAPIIISAVVLAVLRTAAMNNSGTQY